jgi:hypothetical protein
MSRKYIDVQAALASLANDPSWPAVVAEIADIAAWSPTTAEARLLAAIADGVVIACFGDDCEWRIRPAVHASQKEDRC